MRVNSKTKSKGARENGQHSISASHQEEIPEQIPFAVILFVVLLYQVVIVTH